MLCNLLFASQLGFYCNYTIIYFKKTLLVTFVYQKDVSVYIFYHILLFKGEADALIFFIIKI